LGKVLAKLLILEIDFFLNFDLNNRKAFLLKSAAKTIRDLGQG